MRHFEVSIAESGLGQTRIGVAEEFRFRYGPVGADNQRNFSLWLDAFRWIAAALVLVGHVELLFFSTIQDTPPSERSLAGYGFAFLAGFGPQAVMVFFVLSGYLVGGPLLAGLLARRPLDLGTYAAKRLLRLGLVLWPALILTFLLDSLALSIHDPTVFLPPDIHHLLSFPTFICNAAFLQTSACKPYGGDGQLWSLYNEFWYYMTWPLLMCACLAQMNLRHRILLFAFLAVLAIALGSFQSAKAAMVPYMAIWALGALAFVFEGRPIRCPAWLAGMIFVAISVVIRTGIRRDSWIHASWIQFFLDLAVGLAFAHLLLALRWQSSLPPPLGRAWHHRLAGFSYSLYCVHSPILMLMGTWLLYRWGIGSNMTLTSWTSWSVLVGALASTIIAAYVFSLATERHTDLVRQWLRAVGAARQRQPR